MSDDQTKKQEPVKEPPQQKKEAPKEAPQKKKPEVIEKPANCMKCNKRLQRKVWYYRNGGYYCGKGCWELAVQDAAKKKEKAKKEA